MSNARWTRLAAWIVVVMIPMRVLSLGFLPKDDALRHAGKAVTERSWQEILVMRPEATEDLNPGWHWLLGLFHTRLGADSVDLVFAAVIGLYILMAGVGLSRFNPSAWLLTMLIAYVTAGGDIDRWFTGRPYLVSSAAAMFLAERWSRIGPHDWKDWPFLAALFTVVAWIHPSYYLFAIPVAALLVAAETRGALVLGSAVAMGALVAGCLTGHPVGYLYQSLMHPIWSLSWPGSTLAAEFQPSNGRAMFAVTVLSVAAMTRRGAGRALSKPLIAFVLLGWSLGFVSGRFWTDWGFGATAVLLARLLEDWLEGSQTGRSVQRWGIAIAAILFLAATPDTQGRWSKQAEGIYRALTLPASERLLPDPGGILYSDDMRVFYEVFFRKPDAPFRFVLGSELSLMAVEDQSVLREEARTGRIRPLEAWVAKMSDKDRMILRNPQGTPDLAGLMWTQATSELWVGRKEPKPGS